MTGMKPSVDMIMQRKVSGHSPGHVMWSEAKKKAAQKGADVSQLPKDSLGPLLDDFRQYVRGAGEVSRFYSNWDPKTLKPLKETRAKIEAAAQKYEKECTKQANNPALTPNAKTGWKDLATAAHIAGQTPFNMITAFNVEQQKQKLPKLEWNLIK
jgi:hypothetical protein